MWRMAVFLCPRCTAAWRVCDKVDDGTVDSRRLMEERQKLLNDIERLRAENDSLKVLVHHVPHVTVASLLQQGSHASWKVLDFFG